MLPAAFWADFAGRHWEREPRVIEQPFARAIVAPEELFAAIVAASQGHLRARRDRHASRIPHVRFFVDGKALITDVGDHLPRAQDGCTRDYFDRLDRQLDGRPFELVIGELQEHSFAIWSRLRHFLAGLHRHVGLPAARAQALTFIRSQERTSFGVHRDDASVFLFVLAGEKRVLAWPEEVMRGRERQFPSARYERFRDQAIALEGRPGDIIYWPSSHWHIGESPKSPSISINLSLHFWPPTFDVLRQLHQIAESRVAGTAGRTWPFDPDDLAASARTVPAPMRDALAAARATAADPGMERYLEFAWLKRVTAAGFSRVPPPRPHRPLGDDDTVRVVPGEPIVHIPLGDERISCSAAGHAVALAKSPPVSRLLDQLGAGGHHRVGSLVRACAGGDGAGELVDALRGVLEKLVSFRALTVESSRPASDG